MIVFFICFNHIVLQRTGVDVAQARSGRLPCLRRVQVFDWAGRRGPWHTQREYLRQRSQVLLQWLAYYLLDTRKLAFIASSSLFTCHFYINYILYLLSFCRQLRRVRREWTDFAKRGQGPGCENAQGEVRLQEPSYNWRWCYRSRDFPSSWRFHW